VGVGLVVSFSENMPDNKGLGYQYGDSLAKNVDVLDSIAAQLGVTRISAMGGLTWWYHKHGIGTPAPADLWFDPAPGIRTLRALCSYLRENPLVFSPGETQAMCQGLEYQADLLAVAAEHKIRFRFESLD
jgi:hypothetical protein